MKKLLDYVLPAVAAIGMACSPVGCKSEWKARPTFDIPTQVEISDVLFYQHEVDNHHTTCLYKGDSNFSQYFPSGSERASSVEFKVNIYDPNLIQSIRSAFWGDYREDLSPTEKSEKSEWKERSPSTVTMGIPGTVNLKKMPFKVEITDGLGNVTERKFTMEEIVKKAKPYSMRKVKGKCPAKF